MNLDQYAIKACKRAEKLHPCHSIVLYGSYARGDYTTKSDVDMLLVGPGHFRRWNEGNVSFSRYPTSFLSSLAESGSLFALHLKRDGVVITDSKNDFRKTINKLSTPRSYDYLLDELKILANALDVDREQYAQAPAWLNRVALYLMRTAVFAEHAVSGQPCFSIPQISQMSGDDELLRNYQLKYRARVDFDEFLALRSYVEKTLGTAAENRFNSLVEFVLSEARNSDLVRAFGKKIVALSDHPDISNCMVDYAMRCIPRNARVS